MIVSSYLDTKPIQEAPGVIKRDVVFIPSDEHHCIVNNGDELPRFICVIPIAN